MDYFKGRNDIYEKRYFSKNKQSYGWCIACANDFGYGCRKMKQKNPCINCPAASYLPVNEELINSHFRGINDNLGIGIYPLLKDNTCYFLALDFDGDNWFDDLYSVYKTALRFGLYPIMERSSSGSGGHLWLFFETRIRALTARKLGEFLLQETMKVNKNITFKSFDRMFPNQDYLPEGGFGNQIALPLRYSAYKNGHSSFINDLQQVIHNPIEFLASRKKATEKEVLDILGGNQDTDYFFDGAQLRLCFDTENMYVKEMFGKETCMLMIEKRNLNANTINVLKRMASMYNPKYYEMQRLKKPIYYGSTPRVLSVFEEDDNHLILPRGLKDLIIDNFQGTTINLDIQTSSGNPLDVSFKGQLREQQKKAVTALMKYDMGVLKAVPGFGKTVIGIYIISQLKVSTLVIVDKKEIQDQWKERIDEFLDYPYVEKKKDSFVCTYNGSKKRLNGNIDIATAASLINVKDLESVLSQYGLILIDECHHAASNTFTHILRKAPSKTIYGLSATPKRKDGLEKIMYMFCGKIRYETSRHQIQSEYKFIQLLVPRMTNTRILKSDQTYTSICTELMKDTARNTLIVKDIINEYEDTGKIIVISERKEHLNTLYDYLKYIGDDVYVLTGDTKKKERTDILNKVRNLGINDKYILLSTSQLLGEGFDLPTLKSLFLTLPVSSDGRINQYTGRIERNYEGKDVVKVYDYIDVQIPMMQSMYYKRLKEYQKKGYRIEEGVNEISVNQILFEKDDYIETVLQDITNSTKEVIIFTTNINISKIKTYHKLLLEKHTQGVKIHFVLTNAQNDQSEEIEYLNGAGVNVLFQNHNKHFALIDRKVVWNANFDCFGRNKQDGYATRIESVKLVEEIMGVLNLKEQKHEITLF